MNDNGWIKLHRSILTWEWWDDFNVRALFIYCLLKANPTEKQWHGTTIPRGSFVTSLPELAKGTGLSVQKIRTAISKLKSTGEITDQSTREYRIVTICNYSTYQVVGNSEQQTNQQTEQQTNNRQITDNQQTNNSNEEIENNIIIDSSLRSESTSDLPSDASSDAEEKEKIEEEKINYQKLVAFWNENTKGRWGLLRNIENKRRTMVRARIRTYGKEAFAEAILKACASDFLASQQWFSFDWLICPNNFDKVISGNYDNKSIPNNGTVNTATNGTGAVTRPQNKGLSTDF